uniref:Dolichyl-diphosphooligosaccharide--protein glycosyltransferase subunit 3B n=1 Tax=Kalanchoe fedtschenkoi TaxID=63787 RepID=A0A7N0TMX6_KALFE
MAIAFAKPSLRPLLILLAISAAAALSDEERVADLLSLQSRSPSGVIHLDDNSIRRYLASAKPPRSFSILLFFDAVQLYDKSELRLKELKSEFSLLASSYIRNNKGSDGEGKIFFCDLEFKESQASFGLFGVNALPHIRFIGSDVSSLKDSEQMDQGDFARLADSMAEYVEAKTRLTVGPIHRPPILSNKQVGFLLLLVAIMTPFAIKKVIAGETLLHDKKLWLLGSVFVYFFSVSGAMHNIIRKMPLFIADRNDPSRLVFFYQGSGAQLGAEGFAVGFLYTIVGLLLAFMTHVLVRVRSRNVQTLFMFLSLAISFWAVKKVVYLDNWKTGYGIHGFWPKSWN